MPTTNARRTIKGSKDADFRQVLKKRNKKLPLAVGAQGHMKWVKKA